MRYKRRIRSMDIIALMNEQIAWNERRYKQGMTQAIIAEGLTLFPLLHDAASTDALRGFCIAYINWLKQEKDICV
jgi:hypothetical protein